jgi:hypothetical protein
VHYARRPRERGARLAAVPRVEVLRGQRLVNAIRAVFGLDDLYDARSEADA